MLQSSECHRITEPGRDSKTTTYLGSKPCAHAVPHSPEEGLVAKNQVRLQGNAHASQQRRRRRRVLLGAPHEMSAVARMPKPNGINIPRAQALWAGNDRAHCIVDRVVDDMVCVVDGPGKAGGFNQPLTMSRLVVLRLRVFVARVAGRHSFGICRL